jgi:predicted transcriptional regulator
MKKAVTFRFDPDLLERARRSAQADNRTLTNFVETALKAQVDRRNVGISLSAEKSTLQGRVKKMSGD